MSAPRTNRSLVFLLTLAVVLVFASPAHAFGAGNIASIAKIEGQNFRHGDIEVSSQRLLVRQAHGARQIISNANLPFCALCRIRSKRLHS